MPPSGGIVAFEWNFPSLSISSLVRRFFVVGQFEYVVVNKSRKRTTSQAAEKLFKNSKKCQGTTLQLAEKPHCGGVLYQGTSLLVPQGQQNECGALAPAGCTSRSSLHFRGFSATCSVVPRSPQNKIGLQPPRNGLFKLTHFHHARSPPLISLILCVRNNVGRFCVLWPRSAASAGFPSCVQQNRTSSPARPIRTSHCA